MPIDDLAQHAADLMNAGSSGQMSSLNRLAKLAVREVPGCCGASALLIRGRELAGLASTHPDLAELTEAQLRTGQGPLMRAIRDRQPSGCTDTLHEEGWPEFAKEALSRGVRSVAVLVHESPPMAVFLSVASVRAGAISADQAPLASTLAAFGGAVLASASAYGDAQREAIQLRNAVESRAVVDQAKGILMHAHGCTASEALEQMRHISQTSHVKVTEVAERIVAEYSASGPG